MEMFFFRRAVRALKLSIVVGSLTYILLSQEAISSPCSIISCAVVVSSAYTSAETAPGTRLRISMTIFFCRLKASSLVNFFPARFLAISVGLVVAPQISELCSLANFIISLYSRGSPESRRNFVIEA